MRRGRAGVYQLVQFGKRMASEEKRSANESPVELQSRGPMLIAAAAAAALALGGALRMRQNGQDEKKETQKIEHPGNASVGSEQLATEAQNRDEEKNENQHSLTAETCNGTNNDEEWKETESLNTGNTASNTMDDGGASADTPPPASQTDAPTEQDGTDESDRIIPKANDHDAIAVHSEDGTAMPASKKFGKTDTAVADETHKDTRDLNEWTSDLLMRSLADPKALNAIEVGAMRAMQQQARVDAEVLQEELKRRDDEHESALRRLASSDAELLQGAYAEIERVKTQLDEAQRAHTQREQQLQQQHAEEMKNLERKSDEAVQKERTDALHAFDGIREQLNSLSVALRKQSQQYEASAGMHSVSSALQALDQNVSTGEPYSQALYTLSACTDILKDGDAASSLLLHAAKPALARSANTGIPTYAELHEQLSEVLAHAQRTYLVPDAPAGIGAHAASTVASWLRCAEASISDDAVGIEAAISRVREHMRLGNLSTAASELEQVTEHSYAQHEVAKWVANARLRAEADLVMDALRANNLCLTSSFS